MPRSATPPESGPWNPMVKLLPPPPPPPVLPPPLLPPPHPARATAPRATGTTARNRCLVFTRAPPLNDSNCDSGARHFRAGRGQPSVSAAEREHMLPCRDGLGKSG